MSRLCNFSCHYCLVAEKVFVARLSKNYTAGDGTEINPLSLDQLTNIADKIFRQFQIVSLNLIGPMEPLTNPHIVELLRYMLRYKDQIQRITLTTNISLSKKLDQIIEMDWGPKLILYSSLHILDDQFNPFSVVLTLQNAFRHNISVETHVIPSEKVLSFLDTYLKFFGFLELKLILIL